MVLAAVLLYSDVVLFLIWHNLEIYILAIES